MPEKKIRKAQLNQAVIVFFNSITTILLDRDETVMEGGEGKYRTHGAQ